MRARMRANINTFARTSRPTIHAGVVGRAQGKGQGSDISNETLSTAVAPDGNRVSRTEPRSLQSRPTPEKGSRKKKTYAKRTTPRRPRARNAMDAYMPNIPEDCSENMHCWRSSHFKGPDHRSAAEQSSAGSIRDHEDVGNTQARGGAEQDLTTGRGLHINDSRKYLETISGQPAQIGVVPLAPRLPTRETPLSGYEGTLAPSPTHSRPGFLHNGRNVETIMTNEPSASWAVSGYPEHITGDKDSSSPSSICSDFEDDALVSQTESTSQHVHEDVNGLSHSAGFNYNNLDSTQIDPSYMGKSFAMDLDQYPLGDRLQSIVNATSYQYFGDMAQCALSSTVPDGLPHFPESSSHIPADLVYITDYSQGQQVPHTWLDTNTTVLPASSCSASLALPPFSRRKKVAFTRSGSTVAGCGVCVAKKKIILMFYKRSEKLVMSVCCDALLLYAARLSPFCALEV
jgi:hypothetical protein